MAKRSLSRLIKNTHRAGEVLQAMKVSPQWFALTKAYLGFGDLNYPFQFQTRVGQKITLNTFHDLITIWVIFFRHEYKIPDKTKVVIDAGANIGSFSIYASTKAKEIYALEPFPETCAQLQKNITQNKLEDKVKIIPVALANKTGTRNMDLSEGPSQSRGLLGSDASKGLEVKTSTLEDFFNSIGKEKIDLLKIDIEGGEHEVFHSTSDQTLARINNIAMEYHPCQPKKTLFDRIQKANFDLTFDYPISEASGVAYFKNKRP